MSSTLLERARGLHEEVERFERLSAKDFHKEATSHKDRLHQNLRVRQYIDAIQDRSHKLIELYKDEDSSRKEEIAAIAGDNVFSTFYDRLKELRDYHRRHPGLEVPNMEEEEAAILKAQPKVDFSGEEASGKYLDLHEMHQIYSNSKFGKVGVTYLEFLESFSKFADIERQHKMNNSYKNYLGQLQQYLHLFYQKSQPLSCLNDPLAQVEKDFEDKWERGEIMGWEDKGQGASSATCSHVIDLEAFETKDDLEALGADRIKEALVALGLKSGGTLSQRAERLMMTKSKPLEMLDPKLFAKGKVPSKNKAEAERRGKLSKSIALLEVKIQTLMDLLDKTLNETKSNVEKKATSTYEELVADIEDEEVAEPMNEDDEDDDEDIIYNPLKLPLGWDGKPIPYWLYKLHGLNQEFKCEICGNYSYWGRRAFERHFKEYRHQHGMRCLGIPNTKIFNEVTRIEDAKALWESVQKRESTSFTQDQDEEFEDKDGNVYKRKTYLDLQRQGLL